ncbi:hypothetical protein [Streptomyces sp. 150FB]|uniref:hypothetical protein n=1 Tax=Streptomyces sp. 150FB TaxID=1576605 RepID=UPI0013649C2F|nr:hypothetical protein [Streptomyces sp. 150FB]
MKNMSAQVGPHEYGVMVASYAELLEIRDDPQNVCLNARLDPLISAGRVDRDGLHIFMPMLENGLREGVEGKSFRCYLWFLESGKALRSCVLIDVPQNRLSALRRLGQEALEKVVLNLFGELPIEMLS